MGDGIMYLDVHAHIDKYQHELPAAIEQICSDNIMTVSVSMDIDSYERTKEISKHCDLIIPAF